MAKVPSINYIIAFRKGAKKIKKVLKLQKGPKRSKKVQKSPKKVQRGKDLFNLCTLDCMLM